MNPTSDSRKEVEFHRVPLTDPFAPAGAEDGLLALSERLAAEMAEAWRSGRRVSADQLLQEHPELAHSREAGFRLVCEEIFLAGESGFLPNIEELARRFPQWRTEIQRLLECHELLKTEVDSPAPMPCGEILKEFEVVAELGRGAQGRVVLARQVSLADRPVVLKITSRAGQEHLSLARLQHTHICPLYWVHDDPEKDQRLLCMPFFGTVTLHDVLGELSARPAAARAGRDFIAILDRAHGKSSIGSQGQTPSRQFLSEETYARAVCWMGSLLADALQYAHERGLVHLDLKPSNVLLGQDGQPMLLDFHLARPPIRPDGARPSGIGGTPQYMSPEQRSLLASLCEHKPIPLPVDGRSDIFSLGLILYELLGGPVPLPRNAPRLEHCNSAVSPGLADILHKCLAEHPGGRYQEAGRLAADFRRHLADQPLRGVANRSWKERWRKWRRRQPKALPLALSAAALVIVLAVIGFLLNSNRLDRLRDQLAAIENLTRDGTRELDEGRFDAAGAHFATALKLARDTPDARKMIEPLQAQFLAAERGGMAAELHRLTDKIRFHAANIDEHGGLAELEARCRALWGSRDKIVAVLADGTKSEQTSARVDLLDLAVIGSDLRVRLSPEPDAPAAHRLALESLAEAEKMCGPSAVLARARLRHAKSLGLTEEEKAASAALKAQPPRSVWECYALGRACLQADDLEQAKAFLQQALTKEPHHFWSNFYDGVCAYRRHEYSQAVSAFRAALTLRPDSAVCFFNRGLAYSKIPDVDSALADYNQALRLDPDLADAALNRGILYYQQNQLKQAESDLRSALAKGSDPARTHFNLALVYRAQTNRAAALASIREALAARPAFKEARDLERALSGNR